MSFRAAVTASSPPLNSAYRAGKQALTGAHADRVQCAAPGRITGSVEVDETLRALHPQSNRWDYGVGYRPPGKGAEVAIWVEVHPADTSQVSVMLRKRDWLKHYLAADCAELGRLTPRGGLPCPGLVWIQSHGNHILKNSPQARQLATSGIAGPMRVLRLP